jgi:hypothetical protein
MSQNNHKILEEIANFVFPDTKLTSDEFLKRN